LVPSCSVSLRFCALPCCFLLFFFNDPATPEIYTLSLHDALPILDAPAAQPALRQHLGAVLRPQQVVERHPHVAVDDVVVVARFGDRKSTRLNSSHVKISYAVFCLKKKKRDTCHK